MKVRYLQPALAAMLALIMILVASTAVAAEKAPMKEAHGNIATIWLVWVKNGQSRQFEQAVKAYAAWRKNAGEAFNWQVYQPVVGADMGHYVIRSGSHHWADMDTNAAWVRQQHAGQKFEEDVEPYVKRYEHYFTKTDTAHSHWIDSKDYRYFEVTHYNFKPGTHAAVKEAMDKVQKAIIDEKWPYPYEIVSVIGGKGGLSIVSPMKSYAEMAEPDPSLMKILTKSLGSKEAAEQTMNKWSTSVKNYNDTIYVYRPDLSTPMP